MADRIEKECECCGVVMSKRERDSFSQWQKRQYCSQSCSNKSRIFTPLHIRFWDNVEIQEGNKCWFWKGTIDNYGYGRLGVGGREHKSDIKAHRLAYEMRFGPIKDGMVICHTCDNPPCVNPHHLFEGTQADNLQDMSRKGRINPNSLLNLRPGKKGTHGAGPLSKKEMQCQEV